jgi:hypothetical protein
MKNLFRGFADQKKIVKPITDKNDKAYVLQNSVDKINKNIIDFSISICEEFSINNMKVVCKRFCNPEFEMF